MCGIAGFIGQVDHTPAVARMVESMRHRGPDDSGIENIVSGARCVALGNTRLSIIDTSPAGHMPMRDPATGNWIAYNGEVYNFLDIRRELEALGEPFQSDTDTEVILKAYGRWGGECVHRLRGMFAFAVWDARRQELFLARDRVGKKPLYYNQNSAGFLFASEVRALLATGLIERRLDGATLQVYLFNGFTVAPRTMIEGIRSLLPGHWLRVSADGHSIEMRRYWKLDRRGDGNFDLDEIRARLQEAVTLRLVSDVPLGAFLSGGLDSSTVVALMARSGQDVRTFSITFDEAEYDESKFSNQVAQRFQTTHTEVRLRRQDFAAWLPDALAAMDQPTFDGINTYCVARAARESGLTVALSGAGADEVFGGYPYFRTVPWFGRMARLARHVPAPLAGWVLSRLRHQPFRVAGVYKTLELLCRDVGAPDALMAGYQVVQLHYPQWSRQAFTDIGAVETNAVWFGLPVECVDFVRDEIAGDTPANCLSKISLRLHLAERCLRDIDAMSMGVSLEVRAPFLDHLFLESAWQAPGDLRCRGVPNKPFEIEVVRPYLGDDYAYRNKQGFIFPFEEWLRDDVFSERVGAVLSEAELARTIGFRPQAVQELVRLFMPRGHAPRQGRIPWSRIWSLFVLFQWCERHQVKL